MPTTFPTAVDLFSDPTVTDLLNSTTVPHHAQHANINDAMSAVQSWLFNSGLTSADLAALHATAGVALIRGSTTWTMNSDGSAQAVLGTAAKGFSATGTKPATIAGTGTSAGTFWSIVAPNGGDSSGAAGGAGGDISQTTGDGGTSFSGAARGGRYDIHLGVGTSPNVLGNPGIQGQFRLFTQDVGVGVGTRPIVMDAYGVGIGNNTGAIYGTPLMVNWTQADPTGQIAGAQAFFTYSLTADNAQLINAATITLYTDTGAGSTHNVTGAIGALDNEVWVRALSGTLSTIYTVTAYPQIRQGSGANVTKFEGFVAHLSHAGTGTVGTGIGVESTALLSPSGGAADGNYTTTYGFYSGVQNLSTAATPGVYGTYYHYYAPAPVFASTGTPSITNITGFTVAAQFNTYLNTSTTGGFSTIGVDVALGNQGGNTSLTNTNIGLRITGNGGTAGGGGTVVNYAIQSTSTAQALLTGPLVLNSPSHVIGTTATDTSKSLYFHGSGTVGVSQSVVASVWTFGSDATTSGAVVDSTFRTAAASYRMVSGYNFLVQVPIYGASSAVDSVYGLYVNNLGAANATSAVGIRVLAQIGATANTAVVLGVNPGSGTWALYSSLSSASSLLGPLSIGTNSAPTASTLTMAAGWDILAGGGTTSMVAGFNYIPAGAGAPTGVPTNDAAGRAATYYDKTNNFLYVYSSGWKKSTVYA